VDFPTDDEASGSGQPLSDSGYLLVTASRSAAETWAQTQGIPLEALRPVALSNDPQGVTMEDSSQQEG
jgi:hypothetical protein